MKIIIDGSGALGKRTGVGNYIYNLVNQLVQIDKENDYSLYLNYFRLRNTNPFSDDIKTIKNRVPAKIQRFIQNHVHLPIDWITGRSDIFHGPNYFLPPTKRSKKIVTIHDLTFLLHPETMYKNDADYFRKYVPRSIHDADHVLTISNASKNSLIEHLNVAKEKITVTYVAAGEKFRPIGSDQKMATVIDKINLPDEFMLTLSTLEPRKNLVTLVKALDILKKRKQLQQKLVVVGGSGWKNDELFKLIHELGLEEDIIFPGYIGQEDLPALYNACSVFLFPSLYEGFGIPPLEALSCGKACICSNSSSIPEVVGDAAVLVEPLDVEQWAEEIASLMNNPAKIADLGNKGLQQAKKFSWQKMAEETLAVYKK